MRYCQWDPRWGGRERIRYRYSHWPHDVRARRKTVFKWFALVFSVFGLFVVGGAILIIALVIRLLQDSAITPEGLFLLVCVAPLILLILVMLTGGLAFRRVGRPAASMMAAVDSVAEGDLDVRVQENIPGEMGRLAVRFNKMIEELQRAEQQRQNLTADVAHELRTPIHIIQGNLEGIQDGVYEATPEHIAATLEETRILTRLVNDLQTLSLAEAGQLPLHLVPLVGEDLLSDVATSFSGLAEEKEVEIQIRGEDEPGPLEFQGDPDRLNQVLTNLVANALRYTPAGGRITLSAERRGEGVRMVVEDTGPGIPPDDLPYIFDRFWRGDRSRSRADGGGSGLGLAIARQLVRAHGGELSVESQVGIGSRFIIDL